MSSISDCISRSPIFLGEDEDIEEGKKKGTLNLTEIVVEYPGRKPHSLAELHLKINTIETSHRAFTASTDFPLQGRVISIYTSQTRTLNTCEILESHPDKQGDLILAEHKFSVNPADLKDRVLSLRILSEGINVRNIRSDFGAEFGLEKTTLYSVGR